DRRRHGAVRAPRRLVVPGRRVRRVPRHRPAPPVLLAGAGQPRLARRRRLGRPGMGRDRRLDRRARPARRLGLPARHQAGVRAGGDDPAHWHFWRREADLYASWLGGLDGPVRAPGLLERVERDGEIGLWLEDAGPAPGWSADRLAVAARRLGVWQGALLGPRPG